MAARQAATSQSGLPRPADSTSVNRAAPNASTRTFAGSIRPNVSTALTIAGRRTPPRPGCRGRCPRRAGWPCPARTPGRAWGDGPGGGDRRRGRPDGQPVDGGKSGTQRHAGGGELGQAGVLLGRADLGQRATGHRCGPQSVVGRRQHRGTEILLGQRHERRPDAPGARPGTELPDHRHHPAANGDRDLSRRPGRSSRHQASFDLAASHQTQVECLRQDVHVHAPRCGCPRTRSFSLGLSETG